MTSRQSAAMEFASALSTARDAPSAVEDVCRRALDGMAASADLALVFATAPHRRGLQEIVGDICAQTGAQHVLGCTAESIVGTGAEIEQKPAIVLWLAHMPGVDILPMHLEYQPTTDGGSFTGWPEPLPDTDDGNAVLLMLADPFTFPTDALLERLNEDRPRLPIVGGMASGALEPGQNRLVLGPRLYQTGAVAALIRGDIAVQTIVSQGCKPIGRHFVVTRAHDNIIVELGGKPALEQLQSLLEGLSPNDRRLVQSGVHVGLVMNEYQERFDRGDFLVRSVIGADTDSGAIAIADFVRPGQTIQFQVRDALTADEDLRALFQGIGNVASVQPKGGLMFTCNGRGTRLFSTPHHDASVLADFYADLPIAGFFAQGELGPVGGKNFLHGFTASVVLFSPRRLQRR